MRGTIALILILTVGCRATRHPQHTETFAELPSDGLVTLPRLAANLRLDYLGDGGTGYLELSAPPDHVMLVPASTQAVVNGESLAMEYPCMRRGDDYVLTHRDAARVTQKLSVLRSMRRHETPVTVAPLPSPTRTAPATDFPAEWRPIVSSRAWRGIVIHHMASEKGSAAAIHRMHLQRGFDGLGYHFVIGNGTLTRDGHVEVGYRWRRQLVGAHARAAHGDPKRATNYWNENAIGVCLIGHFEEKRPTEAQMESLAELVRALQEQYDLDVSDIHRHRDVAATVCPGRQFPWDELISRVR